MLLAWVALAIGAETVSAQVVYKKIAAADIIRQRVELLDSTCELLVHNQEIASKNILPVLYEQNRFEPLWSRQNASDLIREIINSSDDGLSPEDYHAGALVELQARTLQVPDDPIAAADFDILLTDGLIRLGYHLLFGKVDPERLDPAWNMSRPMDNRDPVAVIQTMLAEGNLEESLERFRPDRDVYDAMRKGLARYRAIEQDGGWGTVPPGPTLRLGMVDDRVPHIRRRLLLSGDLPEGTDPQDRTFDEMLREGVKHFQLRHGLETDGLAGRATLAAMNVPVSARIDQIRVNLERARWVLNALRGRYALVDIAGYRLFLFNNDEEVWSTRVQVGKPFRKTPVFRDEITYLEVNPTWTVPPTILEEDLLPAIRKNPETLQKRRMDVLTFQGKPVDPATVDWKRYSRAKGFPYLLRQRPGPDNALGRIKIMFPNQFAVYLHDTPAQNLFDRASRAFSSGCIRVEHPFELAILLLDDPVNWNMETFNQILATGETTIITLPEPVPVVLLYWTVDMRKDGSVVFKPDIYDRDQAVLEGLNAPFTVRTAPVVRGRGI